MPRPNRDRVMVSFYLARSGRDAIHALAERLGQTKADTYRQLLAEGAKAIGATLEPSAADESHPFKARKGTLRCEVCGIARGRHT